jgi:putative polyhydroxyalkanoate system protein
MMPEPAPHAAAAAAAPEPRRMPSIDIYRKHDKTSAEARKSVEKVARQIAKKFDVEYGWKGSVLHFERTGVHGSIAVEDGLVHVKAHLSFLLLAIQGAVETEIHRVLDKEFG